MFKKNSLPDFLKMANAIQANTSRFAGVESVKFFKESFVKQGFVDTHLQKWQTSKSPFAKRRTLFNQQNLMKSIRVSKHTKFQVVVSSHIKYAEIHNEGGFIVVTEKMKSFFWWKYSLISGATKKDNGSTDWNSWSSIKQNKNKTASSFSKQNKEISSKAKFFKALALMPVGSKIKMPQRQFMGNSKSLFSHLQQFYQGQIITQFKQNLKS